MVVSYSTGYQALIAVVRTDLVHKHMKGYY